ncbi:pilus assembly PilX family protein [Mangrovitalea sediminis]|uniref:pilus assembly PilX family protein n=1 Tax=Mangrovitalea sediminis TaxID=1982043 RepID=UPI000BE54C4B|nr:hypothetical protein [Mangrovitalea sediminis]
MCPERRFTHQSLDHIGRQRGVGLPLALFIIVVLALVVTAMAEMQRGSGEMSSLQIQSERAFLAAESGAQVALSKLIPPGGSAGASCVSPLYQQSFSQPGLGGCRVTVDCRADKVSGVNYYTLHSTGLCGNGLDRASREVEVRAR